MRTLPSEGRRATIAVVPGKISQVVARLVLEGLRTCAPEVLKDAASIKAVTAAGEDGVPLAPYRKVLQDAFDHDGGKALLTAGETLRTLQHPLLFVLLNADAPSLLIEKEARLSAFFHSRHQVVIEHVDATSMTLRHCSKAEPTEPVDNLASCGQHIVLLEEIGCRDLTLRFPESKAPDAAVYEAGERAAPAPGGGYDCWAFTWSSFVPTRKPMSGLDDMLLASAKEAELSDREGMAASVRRVVLKDLGRTWKIADVANMLDMAPRSLQRALGAEGERYSDVVDRTRNDEAARLLKDTELSLTEIGYVCGFADSAHFSRSFKKRFGKIPSAYREVSRSQS